MSDGGIFSLKYMAHLIELHTAGQNQKILFNLDTMVSAERNGDFTAINTRWGYQNVKESLEEIKDKASQFGLEMPSSR